MAEGSVEPLTSEQAADLLQASERLPAIHAASMATVGLGVS